jgi:hypothetical protein
MLSEQENRDISLIPLESVRNATRKGVRVKLYHPDYSKSQLFSITRCQCHYFRKEDDLELSDEKYFIPTVASNPAYDGFMVVEASIVAFQMTTKNEHDAKSPGIRDLKGLIHLRSSFSSARKGKKMT